MMLECVQATNPPSTILDGPRWGRLPAGCGFPRMRQRPRLERGPNKREEKKRGGGGEASQEPTDDDSIPVGSSPTDRRINEASLKRHGIPPAGRVFCIALVRRQSTCLAFASAVELYCIQKPDPGLSATGHS